MFKVHFLVLIFLLFNIFFMSNSFALSTDRGKPIELEADSADLDDKKGISIYRGSVVLIQGSTRLEADKLILYHNSKHKLIKIESYGKPARFKQRPDGQKQDVEAIAHKMIYINNKEIIHLYKKAKFKQGKNSFSGDNISYDMKNDLVKANKKKGSSGRVKVIIQPNQASNQASKE